MKFNVLPIWAQIAIVGVAISFIFGLGWKVNGWRLSTKVTNLQQEIIDLKDLAKGWEEEKERCDENKQKLTDALAEVEEQSREIEAATNRAIGAEKAAHRIALELADARSELSNISSEYSSIEAAAVNQTVCQTYESVLWALAGEGASP